MLHDGLTAAPRCAMLRAHAACTLFARMEAPCLALAQCAVAHLQYMPVHSRGKCSQEHAWPKELPPLLHSPSAQVASTGWGDPNRVGGVGVRRWPSGRECNVGGRLDWGYSAGRFEHKRKRGACGRAAALCAGWSRKCQQGWTRTRGHT